MPYRISIETETDSSDAVGVGGLAALAERVMEGEGCRTDMSLSCLLTDDPTIRALNRQFLGIDEPTDVLAFPDEEDDEFVEGFAAGPHLGDVAISLDTAGLQARESGHSIDDELAHLLVHGLLHLCGYDHVADAGEAERMRAREEHYIGAAAAHVHRGESAS